MPDNNKIQVQIMGAGSIGSLIGGLLSHAGNDVLLVGRKEHVRAVNENGLKVAGEFDFTTYAKASTTPREVDTTILTVKSFDTREAAHQLVGKQDVVLSLQNGMGNEEVLDEVLDSQVLAGTTTYGANLVEPGVVECTGKGVVDIGISVESDFDVAETEASRLARLMQDAGIDVHSRSDMPRRLWEKLAINAGINPVTALTQLTNGEAAQKCEGVMRAAAEETAEVARLYGVEIDPQETSDLTIEVAEATSRNESSMLQDVKRGQRTEIEAINGYVVGKASEFQSTDKGDEKIDVRVNTTLTRLVKGLESSYLSDGGANNT